MKPTYLMIVVLSVPLLASCGSDPTTPAPTPNPSGIPAVVSVSPANDTLDAFGLILNLSVEVLDGAGKDLGDQGVVWTSQDPSVATVSSSGTVRSVSNGTSDIIATLGGLADTAVIRVAQVPANIILGASRRTLAGSGDSVPVTAEVRDRRGSALEPQPSIVWTSDDSTVARVDPSGLVTATGWGRVAIRARADTVTSGIQFTAFSITGEGAVPELDRQIVALMDQWKVPGVGVGFVKNGILVSLRGYGLADSAGMETMRPDHLFRIASISKPITGVAVLKAIENGTLSLQDSLIDLLPDLMPPGGPVDPRVRGITVEQLLHHRAGWDRAVAGDPMFTPHLLQVASDLGIPAPPPVDSIARWLLGQPLQFQPGTQFRYSNVGYMILGRILERVTGMSYEQYVTGQILAPMGVTSAAIGLTRRVDRLPGEVVYYSSHPGGTSMYGDGFVSAAYGSSFDLPSTDSHGGWVISVADLLRFAIAVDGDPVTPEFLSPQWQQYMVQDGGGGYGAGWFLNPSNWNHSGGLPGTSTILVTYVNPIQRPGLDGFSVAILLNAWPQVPNFSTGFYTALLDAAEAVGSWPTNDLFGTY